MTKYTNSCDGAYSSLDIRFTKACDNNCAFCIEKQGLDAQSKAPNVNKLIESTIKSGIKNILIVGGEPMLYPIEVNDFINGVRNSVNEIYITSSLPRTFFSDRDYWNMILMKCEGFNVSIQDLNYIKNNEVLNAKSDHNRIYILEELIKQAPTKIRVNLNLTKSGINSRDKLDQALRTLEKMGCRSVKLNELQNAPDEYISYEDIMGVKMKSPFSDGCQSRLRFKGYAYETMKVILKRSCFYTEQSRKASFKDLVKCVKRKYFHTFTNDFKVLYENGKIENNWIVKPKN